VQHHVHSTSHALALNLYIERVIYELRFSLGFAGNDATSSASSLIARAGAEIRILKANRISIALYFRAALSGI
jgi:hypothetical protein